jgi:ADP-heptose:LPS heptosyltransferase
MKVLIIKPSSFGDIVCAFPAANALKQAYGNVSISWLVFKQWEEVVRLCGDADDIISWDRQGGLKEFFHVLRIIRETKFDYIFDLQGLLRSAIMARLAKGKNKIGVSGMKEMSGIFIKEVYPQNAKINAVLRNLETIRYATQKPCKPAVNLRIDDETYLRAHEILKRNNVNGEYIALLPFARGAGKNWSIENYKELIKILYDKYPAVNIVVLSTAQDFGKIGEGVFDLSGQTTISELAAIVSKSKVCIGADTGSMHLAAMLNVPCVFIFGKSDSVETAPYLGKFAVLVNKKSHKDIDKISPTKVFEAIEEVLK